MPESMSPTVEFTSVAKEFRHEYIVDKSRFITTIYPCTTEEEAQAFIGRINKEFWDATHNCTAYALGPKQEQQRSSDNGEPSGTAGKPMLEVLKKNELKDVAVVVTRYFGGTKLGAGGLVRAYSGAVSEGLKAIGIVECRLEDQLALTFDYAHVGKVEYYCQTQNIPIVDKVFLNNVQFTCSLPVQEVEAFQAAIIELLQNQVEFESLGEMYTEYPVG